MRLFLSVIIVSHCVALHALSVIEMQQLRNHEKKLGELLTTSLKNRSADQLNQLEIAIDQELLSIQKLDTKVAQKHASAIENKKESIELAITLLQKAPTVPEVPAETKSPVIENSNEQFMHTFIENLQSEIDALWGTMNIQQLHFVDFGQIQQRVEKIYQKTIQQLPANNQKLRAELKAIYQNTLHDVTTGAIDQAIQALQYLIENDNGIGVQLNFVTEFIIPFITGQEDIEHFELTLYPKQLNRVLSNAQQMYDILAGVLQKDRFILQHSAAITTEQQQEIQSLLQELVNSTKNAQQQPLGILDVIFTNFHEFLIEAALEIQAIEYEGDAAELQAFQWQIAPLEKLFTIYDQIINLLKEIIQVPQFKIASFTLQPNLTQELQKIVTAPFVSKPKLTTLPAAKQPTQSSEKSKTKSAITSYADVTKYIEKITRQLEQEIKKPGWAGLQEVSNFETLPKNIPNLLKLYDALNILSLKVHDSAQHAPTIISAQQLATFKVEQKKLLKKIYNQSLQIGQKAIESFEQQSVQIIKSIDQVVQIQGFKDINNITHTNMQAIGNQFVLLQNAVIVGLLQPDGFFIISVAKQGVTAPLQQSFERMIIDPQKGLLGLAKAVLTLVRTIQGSFKNVLVPESIITWLDDKILTPFNVIYNTLDKINFELDMLNVAFIDNKIFKEIKNILVDIDTVSISIGAKEVQTVIEPVPFSAGYAIRFMDMMISNE